MFSRLRAKPSVRRRTGRRRFTLRTELLEDRRLLAGLVAQDSQALDHSFLLDGSTPAILEDASLLDSFGETLASGDFNGDSFPDMAVGVPRENDVGLTNTGAVHVIYGKPRGLTARNNQLWAQDDLQQSQGLHDKFGAALAVGDFNGDFFDDLAIGAPSENSDDGAVHIVYGSGSGLTSLNARYFLPSQGNIALQDQDGIIKFGWALTAGDFDDNGYDDLAIGAPMHDVDGDDEAGSVVVLSFQSANFNVQVFNQDNAISHSSSDSQDMFGSSLAAGDFNGDQQDDLAIGVPGEGGFLLDFEAGEVDVLYGSGVGLTPLGNQDWSQDSPGIAGSNEDFDHFGTAVSVGDFNRDGYDDLAIGIPGEDDDKGAVSVIYGSVDGLTSDGNARFEQGSGGLVGIREADDFFGQTLATGDFNADGHDDLAVGTPFEGVVNPDHEDGEVALIFGTSAGLNGTGSRVLHEFSTGMPGSADSVIRYGAALAAADLDRDGRAELVVGAPRYNVNSHEDAGQVYVHYAGVSTADFEVWHQDVTSLAARDDLARFGTALATGDFDNDGHADLVVGSPDKWLPNERTGGLIALAGVVNVIYGSDGAGDLVDLGSGQIILQDQLILEGGAETGDRFGSALAAGDFNNDGNADLAIGVPHEDLFDPGGLFRTNAGAVHVILGTSEGLTGDNFGLAQGRWRSADVIEQGDNFGAALAVGDFDNDGFDDLAVGVPGQQLNGHDDAGTVHVLYGNQTGIPGWERDDILTQRANHFVGAESGDRFGATLAAGDFDDDGNDDLAIGSPGEDVATSPRSSIANAGAVGVMYGEQNVGLTHSRSLLISQSYSGNAFDSGFGIADVAEIDDQFGIALAVGDFNLDSRDDLAIGVPYEDLDTDDDGLQADAGAVHVVYAGSSGLQADGNELWRQDTGLGSPTVAPGVAQHHDAFGRALAAGDFDGNSSDELVIGAPYDAGPTMLFKGTVTVIYSDGTDGLQEDEAQQWSPADVGGPSNVFNEAFGAALAVGDFNMNGISDLAIGAPETNLSADDLAGRVYAMHGTPRTTFNSTGDFDGDGELTIHDIDLLTAEAAAGNHNPFFDLTFDDLVNRNDVDFWILDLKGTLIGDSNLDGAVDVSDFNRWNAHKFTSVAAWSAGDFNADGVVDVSDFNIWNGNKFQSSASFTLPMSRRLYDVIGAVDRQWNDQSYVQQLVVLNQWHPFLLDGSMRYAQQ